MISFSTLDIFIIISFLIGIVSIGLFSSKINSVKNDEDYLLSGRNVGMVLFILTNVATWYGGILGVGEFSYKYGLVSWLTQGFPYYIFAIIFALTFAEKIRSAKLYTIPDKLENIYGKKVSLISAILVFILVSPAPYLLMMSQIISLIFNIDFFLALVISAVSASIYLIKGGYRSNIWADAFSFFVMFCGFIIIVFVAENNFGGITFLKENLPEQHLSLTGEASVTFISVWFLIALWTFTDPGFHQRCYSAKSGKIAKWGILISIIFWIFFDFLTNTTGLYAKAILPNLENPVLAFPYLAQNILSSGYKGIFFAAMIATILSTLNSFIFLSATTFSVDFISRILFIKTTSSSNVNSKELNENISNKFYKSFFIKINEDNKILIKLTQLGIVVTLILSIFIAYYFQSVVELWYIIGSICIPGLIIVVVSAYYPKISIDKTFALFEILIGLITSIIWIFIRSKFQSTFLSEFEPMIIGLFFALIIHLIGIIQKKARLISLAFKS
ncbi:MAG: sodium:solute symporter family protein [Ignavibacteriae bacterium]|nr:sodium:solute symporter family protein [Ignavibacteriota bacterium]